MQAQAHPDTCLGRIWNLYICNLNKPFSIYTHGKFLALLDAPVRCIPQVPLLCRPGFVSRKARTLKMLPVVVVRVAVTISTTPTVTTALVYRALKELYPFAGPCHHF
ncbi:hypothetical protein RHMOL_Rhmol11G0142800 [Rhododendron molle]|uniref:Uncharacterized protein n=1 Tax=Rhododendron molle TaxID=49168 RepID=A0ACC0LT77_RHOML|nr:hypothetical protein RHMOL_Rhmol11G0142800 [Rhododendron molle]